MPELPFLVRWRQSSASLLGDLELALSATRSAWGTAARSRASHACGVGLSKQLLKIKRVISSATLWVTPEMTIFSGCRKASYVNALHNFGQDKFHEKLVKNPVLPAQNAHETAFFARMRSL